MDVIEITLDFDIDGVSVPGFPLTLRVPAECVEFFEERRTNWTPTFGGLATQAITAFCVVSDAQYDVLFDPSSYGFTMGATGGWWAAAGIRLPPSAGSAIAISPFTNPQTFRGFVIGEIT